MSVLTTAGLDDDERALLAAYWGVTEPGSWEGSNILHRTGASTVDDDLLARGRSALLAVRERRVRPARDDKQLAAWNGFALRAVAHAALVLDAPRYEEATRRLVGFIAGTLVREGDRLWRTARAGRAHTPAFAEDYLAVADGLLAAHVALGDAESLLLARRLADTAIRDFWDDEGGTFVDTSDEHDRTVARPRGLVDNATPSANSIGADVLQRLGLLTGDESYQRRAGSILRAVASALERQPSAFGRMLSAADRWLGEPVDVVVAADGEAGGEASALRRAAIGPFVPNLVLTSVTRGERHAGWALYEGKVVRGGTATAYACRGYACDEPTADPARLAEQVDGLSRRGT
jgi:hypothetical protein